MILVVEARLQYRPHRQRRLQRFLLHHRQQRLQRFVKMLARLFKRVAMVLGRGRVTGFSGVVIGGVGSTDICVQSLAISVFPRVIDH